MTSSFSGDSMVTLSGRDIFAHPNLHLHSWLSLSKHPYRRSRRVVRRVHQQESQVPWSPLPRADRLGPNARQLVPSTWVLARFAARSHLVGRPADTFSNTLQIPILMRTDARYHPGVPAYRWICFLTRSPSAAPYGCMEAFPAMHT